MMTNESLKTRVDGKNGVCKKRRGLMGAVRLTDELRFTRKKSPKG